MEPVGQLPAAAAAGATGAPEPAIDRTPTFFVFITGADAGNHESVCFCTEERDWTNLLPELVEKVAKLALRSDVTDYIRLRAVCKPWRAAAKDDPKLMGMNPRFFPRNWDILAIARDARNGRTRFVNALTGASIRLQIPPEYGEVIASAEGCLILASDCKQKLRLFNPVTRAVAYLPAVPYGSEINAAGFLYDGGADADTADPTVVLCTVDHDKIFVFAKPGSILWHILDDDEDGEVEAYSVGGLSVRGKFYVPTATGNVRKLEYWPEPHLVYVATQEARHRWWGSSLDVTSSLETNIDDADGGMMLLRYIADSVQVFRVNFTYGEGSLTLVEDQEDVGRYLQPWWLTLESKSND
ncbi:unnamed protein product [Alopecurus aequalis]